MPGEVTNLMHENSNRIVLKIFLFYVHDSVAVVINLERTLVGHVGLSGSFSKNNAKVSHTFRIGNPHITNPILDGCYLLTDINIIHVAFVNTCKVKYGCRHTIRTVVCSIAALKPGSIDHAGLPVGSHLLIGVLNGCIGELV